jgi:hypothetical protein
VIKDKDQIKNKDKDHAREIDPEDIIIIIIIAIIIIQDIIIM